VRAFLFRNPPLWAVVAALLVPESFAPELLTDIARVVVYVTLPAGFLIVGITLAAEAEDGEVAFPPPFTAPVAAALGLRLLVAPALMLALTALTFDVPDTYLIEAAMPVGVNSLVVAHATGLDIRLCASALAWSTAVVVAAALVIAAV
jgi:predicted permease